MKKGVVIALCVVVVAAAGGAVWWWKSRESAVATDKTVGAPVVAAPSAADLGARAERNRQRIQEHIHLWREASYIDVRQLAQDGNVVAQRRLSEIYEDCRAYDGTLRSNLEILPKLADSDPASEATVASVQRTYNRLCTQAGADLRKNPGSAEYWLHKSAKAGDLASEMRYFGRTVPDLSLTQFQYFVDKVRASGDPDAVFELSLLLPKLKEDWQDPALAPAFKGQIAQTAWTLAACRAGYDCARGSRLMSLLCVSMFSCAFEDYERYLHTTTGYDSQRPQVERLIALINRSILAPKAK